ncbi:hypothetical protein MNBD_GAMMA06-1753 [hydrothermal vent metagenome]|uniref:Uncharacterized protein n=1 Tax=hydrothermal vent metagenome TaxID=652676 RepID=A0A3B0W466_9ZZZZ
MGLWLLYVWISIFYNKKTIEKQLLTQTIHS